MELTVGDVVGLISGGVSMTVEAVYQSSLGLTANCVWFKPEKDGWTGPYRGSFLVSILKKRNNP